MVASAKRAAAALGILAFLLGLLAGSIAQAEDVPRGGTYKLVDPVTGQVERTGRTKDLARREREHQREFPKLKFQIDRRTDNYAEQRGREQLIWQQYPHAKHNHQKPIADNNKNRPEYMKAAENMARPTEAPARAAQPKAVGGVDMTGEVTVKEEAKKPAPPPVQNTRPAEDAVFWDQQQPASQ